MRVPKLNAVHGVIGILSGLVVLVSCGGGEQADRERAEAAAEDMVKATTGKDADVEIDGQSIRIKGEGFSHDIAEASAWPADMFPGVPEFTSGTIERVSKGEEGGMMKFNIYFREIESGAGERYVGLLKEAGWQADFTSMGPQGGLIAGQKDNLGVNFMLNHAEKSGMLAVFSLNE